MVPPPSGGTIGGEDVRRPLPVLRGRGFFLHNQSINLEQKKKSLQNLHLHRHPVRLLPRRRSRRRPRCEPRQRVADRASSSALFAADFSSGAAAEPEPAHGEADGGGGGEADGQAERRLAPRLERARLFRRGRVVFVFDGTVSAVAAVAAVGSLRAGLAVAVVVG